MHWSKLAIYSTRSASNKVHEQVWFTGYTPQQHTTTKLMSRYGLQGTHPNNTLPQSSWAGMVYRVHTPTPHYHKAHEQVWLTGYAPQQHTTTPLPRCSLAGERRARSTLLPLTEHPVPLNTLIRPLHPEKNSKQPLSSPNRKTVNNPFLPLTGHFTNYPLSTL